MWFIRMASKVEGPYTFEKLCELRKLKKFTPLHQISQDKARWESAAQLILQIDAVLQGAPPGPADPSRTGTTSTATRLSGVFAASQPKWYYATAEGASRGPVSTDQILELVSSGQLQANSNVCRVGEQGWQRLDAFREFVDVPFGNSSKTIAIAAATAIGLLLLAGLASAGFAGARIKDFLVSVASIVSPKQKESGKSDEHQDSDKHQGVEKHRDGDKDQDAVPRVSLMVSAATKNDPQLSSGLGLVLGTMRFPYPNGTPGPKVEIGEGSSFAITSDGYLMTNRHVAVMGTPEGAKKSAHNVFTMVINKKKATLQSLIEHPPESASKKEVEAAIKETVDGINAISRRDEYIQMASTDVAPKLTVFFDGVPFEAKVVHISTRFDMAILKVSTVRARPYFALGAANEVEGGAEIAIVGFPGAANDPRTEGERRLQLVSAPSGKDPESQLQPRAFVPSYERGWARRSIQDSDGIWNIDHELKTFHGNSGSPVLLMNGLVVGIDTTMTTPNEQQEFVNIAFSTGQFRKEIDEFVPHGVVWK